MGIWIALGVLVALAILYVLLSRRPVRPGHRNIDADAVAEVRVDALAFDMIHRQGLPADSMRTSSDDQQQPRDAD